MPNLQVRISSFSSLIIIFIRILPTSFNDRFFNLGFSLKQSSYLNKSNTRAILFLLSIKMETQTKELSYYNLDKIIKVKITDCHLSKYKYLPDKYFKLLWLISLNFHKFFLEYPAGWYSKGDYGYKGWNLIDEDIRLKYYFFKPTPVGSSIEQLYAKATILIHFENDIVFEKYFETFEEAENYLKENLPRIYNEGNYKVL